MNAEMGINELHHAALHATYRNLQNLATDSVIPAVQFAARAALAEVHIALVAIGEDFDFYTVVLTNHAAQKRDVAAEAV